MLHENSDSSDPAAWLRYARGDLALAQVSLPEDSFYDRAQNRIELSLFLLAPLVS